MILVRVSHFLAVLLTMFISSYSGADAWADPVPVDNLFGTAAVVLRGEVKQFTAVERADSEWHGVPTVVTRYRAQVVTDRIYKGTASATVTITYIRPDDRLCAVSPCIELKVGDHNYFFLNMGKQGLELDDPKSGKFRAPRRTEFRDQTGLDALKNDFVVGLNDPDDAVRLTQIELVGASGRKTDAEQLLRILPTGDALTNATIYHSLLQLGDYSTLTSMRTFLEARSNVPAIERLRFLCLSQVNAITDPAAVDVLIDLAQSPSDDVRESAIHALRSIKAAKAIPVFIRALDDRVQVVRYDAVIALAELEHNWTLAPSFDAFRENEGKYIVAWKLWRQTSRQAPTE